MYGTYGHPITEATVRNLEEELYSTRSLVLRLLPPEMRVLVESFEQCESRTEANRWAQQITDRVLEQATVVFARNEYTRDRAHCPLCGDGTVFEGDGFIYPEGLRRHLTGWGNIQKCGVLRAATKLARDYWNCKFRRDDELGRIKTHELEKQRRKHEQLYQISPFDGPCLADEHCYGGTPRNAAGLAWAEQRLTEMGLSVLTSDNIKTYLGHFGNSVVYADPRVEGSIEFKIYPKTPTGKAKRAVYRRYVIQDGWKNNLGAKLEDACR